MLCSKCLNHSLYSFAALTITSPSASSYWVQYATNTIAWATASGDPTSVSILIINPANKGFNGPFAIAEYVKVSKLSFDVTNVQLVVADGPSLKQVQFVDPANHTQVLATSAPFSVKVSGTPDAQVTYAPGTPEAKSSMPSNSTVNSNSTSRVGSETPGNSSKTNNGNASGNAKSSSAISAALPSIAAFAFGSLLALAC
ncbi:uncharacterized protein VP01_2760g2 [Puccinia sorghi]|uniref:Yeast cell wall synthesis Kre9/Knh1-like N-terminal domain-containing protein n=1 Tax=Puccinia sorghi TaxID=27349 RepID=A0A0L6V2Y0_9BASI|nr:uncharacterized protein VP01_2760g2 [Puccinia sorghi]